jgi:DNA-binding transcriptional regulator YiaG
LLSIGLRDLQIAMRLHVTRKTVRCWRNQVHTPTARHQQIAKIYLAELQNKIAPVLQSA